MGAAVFTTREEPRAQDFSGFVGHQAWPDYVRRTLAGLPPYGVSFRTLLASCSGGFSRPSGARVGLQVVGKSAPDLCGGEGAEASHLELARQGYKLTAAIRGHIVQDEMIGRRSPLELASAA